MLCLLFCFCPGYYTLSDEEFRKLDAGVIDYSRSGTQTAPESTQSPGAEESLDPEAPAPPTTASPVPQPEESEVNRRYGRADYLPCIAWGALARVCGDKEVGDTLCLTGRLQSRVYRKLVNGVEEERVAYEVYGC